MLHFSFQCFQPVLLPFDVFKLQFLSAASLSPFWIGGTMMARITAFGHGCGMLSFCTTALLTVCITKAFCQGT